MAASRYDLLRAARLCGWPACTVGRHLLSDEAAWQAIVPLMTPPERQRLLSRLGKTWLLTVTPGGRAHLRAWLDAGGPTPPPDALPRVHGDITALAIVAAGLRHLPTPVRHFAVTLAFDCVGYDSAAWIGPPSTGALVVRISPFTTPETVAHEVAHGWHRSARVGTECPTAQEWTDAYAAARRLPDGGRALIDDDEVLADACALAWSG